jgi:hypothetical protein
MNPASPRLLGRNRIRKSHGSNAEETRIRDEKLLQEQTEKTEKYAEFLFSLLSPVESNGRTKSGTKSEAEK